jgi:signal transduction histidine kinase/CheY-like chemotaxis protein
MQHNPPLYKSPVWLRYAIPLGTVSIVTILRLTVLQEATANHPLSLFIIPVMISAWCGGAAPGVFATILGVITGTILFGPYSSELETSSAWVRIFFFILASAVCVFVIARLHYVRYKAEQEILKRTEVEVELHKEIARCKHVEEQLAEALQKAEFANQAKTDFLSNMSHEIRTPLNAVVGVTRILAMSNPLTPKQKECVSTLQLSASSLLTLITDVLDVSKIEAGAIELESVPFNLRQICQDVVGMMTPKANEKNLHLILESDSIASADYIGDPQRIKQVIINLCGNAIKFTDSGFISIGVRSDEISAEMDNVCIYVKDTGIGIPADYLPKIFDQFVQGDASIHKKYGGTGLGLTISKRFIDAMGGTITVESKYAVGSTFKIRLALKKAPKVVARLDNKIDFNDVEVSSSYAKEKILIVEDNEANILVLTSYMERFGYAYDIAMTGGEALKKIEKENYLAVLMDVRMPGLDGLDTTLIIRRNERLLNRNRLHIIGVTANAMASDRQQCYEAGMDDFMTKPYEPVLLEKKLRDLSWTAPASVSASADA